jgi:hypothetical protein
VVADLEAVGVDVEGHCLVVQTDVGAGATVLFGGSSNQLVDVGDQPAHDEGDPAGRVARPGAHLQGHDLQVGSTLPCLGDGGHTARVAADHDQTSAHGPRR